VEYRILSRHDTVSNEKCPNCLTIFQHFLDFADARYLDQAGRLACLKCGTVFISKRVREELTPGRIKDILEQQSLEEANDENSEYFKNLKLPHSQTLEAAVNQPDTDAGKTPIAVINEMFTAPCGFEAKTKAGQVNHSRSCDKCGEVAS
jgi:hypothetical protein